MANRKRAKKVVLPPVDVDRILSLAEVSLAIGRHRSTIWKEVKAGKSHRR